VPPSMLGETAFAGQSTPSWQPLLWAGVSVRSEQPVQAQSGSGARPATAGGASALGRHGKKAALGAPKRISSAGGAASARGEPISAATPDMVPFKQYRSPISGGAIQPRSASGEAESAAAFGDSSRSYPSSLFAQREVAAQLYPSISHFLAPTQLQLQQIGGSSSVAGVARARPMVAPPLAVVGASRKAAYLQSVASLPSLSLGAARTVTRGDGQFMGASTPLDSTLSGHLQQLRGGGGQRAASVKPSALLPVVLPLPDPMLAGAFMLGGGVHDLHATWHPLRFFLFPFLRSCAAVGRVSALRCSPSAGFR
jgi:hypothetical protein